MKNSSILMRGAVAAAIAMPLAFASPAMAQEYPSKDETLD